jgi:hypothetical protein
MLIDRLTMSYIVHSAVYTNWHMYMYMSFDMT